MKIIVLCVLRFSRRIWIRVDLSWQHVIILPHGKQSEHQRVTKPSKSVFAGLWFISSATFLESKYLHRGLFLVSKPLKWSSALITNDYFKEESNKPFFQTVLSSLCLAETPKICVFWAWSHGCEPMYIHWVDTQGHLKLECIIPALKFTLKPFSLLILLLEKWAQSFSCIRMEPIIR